MEFSGLIASGFFPHCGNTGDLSLSDLPLEDTRQKFQEKRIDFVLALDTSRIASRFQIDSSDQLAAEANSKKRISEFPSDWKGMPGIAERLIQEGEKSLFFPERSQIGLEKSLGIVLEYLFPDHSVPVLPMVLSGTEICSFRWGRFVRKTLEDSRHTALVLTSGCFSHNLDIWSAGQDHDEIRSFDEKLMKFLENGQGTELLYLDADLKRNAMPKGQLLDLFFMLGVLGSRSRGKILAYNPLPGIGTGLIRMEKQSKEDCSLLESFYRDCAFYEKLYSEN